MSERDKQRWAAAQSVLGEFVKQLESSDVEKENYEDAAGWRDLNKKLQESKTHIDHISVKAVTKL